MQQPELLQVSPASIGVSSFLDFLVLWQGPKFYEVSRPPLMEFVLQVSGACFPILGAYVLVDAIVALMNPDKAGQYEAVPKTSVSRHAV